MKKVFKIALMCFVCTVLSVACAACFFNKETVEETTSTQEKTTYVFQVYDADGNFVNTQIVERGTQEYVYFGDTRYEFHGYFTQKDGKGNQITDETGEILRDFRAPDSLTSFPIYPYISKITYAISFETKCSEVVPDETHTADEAFDLPTVTRTGYQFIGWSKDSGDWTGIKDVYAGLFYRDTTLYAVYRANTSNVFYYVTSSYYDGKLEVAYDSNYTVPYTEETGYNFVGYYTQENGQGERLTESDGQSLSTWNNAEKTVNIYAHYVPAETYTLTYANDGLLTGIEVTYKNWALKDGEPVDRTVFYNDGETIACLIPDVREGYYFDGWYKDYLLRNKYDFTTEQNVSEELVLYAKWEKTPSITSNVLSRATEGTITLIYGEATTNDMKFFCDFSGTFTIHYKLRAPDNNKTHGALVSIADAIFEKPLEDGDSGSVEITVRKGDIFGITGKAKTYSERPILMYWFENLPETVSQKKVKMPSEFTYTVTNGNSYKLPVYDKKYCDFVGYYSQPDGKGTRLTDENGKSYTVWTGNSDTTVYPYYNTEKP